MDTAQIILLVIISILTLLLVFIGVQVFLVLKEVKRSIQKVNQILDEAETITSSVMQPLSNFSSALNGVKTVASLFGIFAQKKHKKEDE